MQVDVAYLTIDAHIAGSNPMTRFRNMRTEIERPLRLRSKLAGFTLVEMLISVTLVLIVMLLFTQIFQIATESLSRQRGLAENDQRARLLTTIIRGDLERRTFRDVIPFLPGQDTSRINLLRRSGYFYYAENDPYSDTDDVLQFTGRTSNNSGIPDTVPFVGKASGFQSTSVQISAESASPSQISLSGGDYRPALSFTAHIWISGSVNASGQLSNDGRFTLSNVSPTFDSGSNTTTVYLVESIAPMAIHGIAYLTELQPDMDDGVAGNGLGQSPAAEISYFMRGTNLYRRVLLIRDPHDDEVQPMYMNGQPLISTLPGYGTYPSPLQIGSSPSFWNDFDYSAFYSRGFYNGAGGLVGAGPRFHSVNISLNNSATSTKELAFNSAPGTPLSPDDEFRNLSLGCPQTRFGHDPCTGLPREYTGTGAGVDYIGRFTLMECSNPGFGYPGRMLSIPTAADPTKDIHPLSPKSVITLDGNSNVAEYATDKSRRGEDILMTNVLGFDLKIWDSSPGVNGFVDIGDDNATAAYSSGKLLNAYYCPTTTGPRPKTRYRYDTWHPNAEAVNPATSPSTLPNRFPPFKNPADPVDLTATSQLPLKSLQVTVTYRDRSSGLVRQLTIIQSLLD